jgi:hypothetical protein
MPGLDPASINLQKTLSEKMDHRVKPGDDELSVRSSLVALRPNDELLNGFNLFLPVQTCLQKYSASSFNQITSELSPSRPERGAYRDRHGRRERDAVDAAARVDERCCCGRPNRVVLTPRRWRQVSRKRG